MNEPATYERLGAAGGLLGSIAILAKFGVFRSIRAWWRRPTDTARLSSALEKISTVVEEMGRSLKSVSDNMSRMTDNFIIAEAMTRALADRDPTPMYQCEILGGNCIWTNIAMQKLFGRTKEQMLGSGWAEAIVPDHQDRVLSHWRNSVVNSDIYNCFHADTKFISRSGVRSFAQFKNGDSVSVVTHSGEWADAVVRNHGKQPLQRVVIRRGKLRHEVCVTPNHTWILRDGTRTMALRVGDTILEAPHTFRNWNYDDAPPEERLAWAYGYVFGDGTCYRCKGEKKWPAVRLCGKDKAKFLSRFEELGFKNSSPKSFGGDAMVYTGHYLKDPLDPSLETIEVLRAFVRGYLDADGSKNFNRPASRDGATEKELLKIQATGKKHQDFIRSVFPMVGQYITYEHDRTGEETNLGKRGDTTEFGLTNYVFDYAAKLVVESIEPMKPDEVWCLNVPGDHSFVLPFGASTGNCNYPIEKEGKLINLRAHADFIRDMGGRKVIAIGTVKLVEVMIGEAA